MYPPTEPDADQPDDFQIAVQAMTRAVHAINAGDRGGDGAEFVTQVVAAVAANLGSSHADTQARPGSWEAAKVRDMLESTVGYDDEYLLTYRTEPIEVVVNLDAELDDLGLYEAYQGSVDFIGEQLFGARYAPALVVPPAEPGPERRSGLTPDELEQFEDVETLLYDLEIADRTEYKRRFTEAAHTELERLRSESPMRYPATLTVTVRTPGDSSGLTEVWTGDLASRLYEHARNMTPLPGSETLPDHADVDHYGLTLLNAGYWPHLRIPELAHYGAPTRNTTTSDTIDKEN